MNLLLSNNINKYIIIILLFIIFPIFCYSQSDKLIDSLILKSKSVTDTGLVNLLNKIALYKRYNSPNDGLNYSSRALNESKKLNYITGIAESYKNFGILYYSINKFDSSLFYFNLALKQFEYQRNSKKTAIIYTNIGAVYSFLGNYPESLKNHFKALQIQEQNKDTFGRIITFNNIAYVFNLKGDKTKALEYYKKNIEFSKSLKQENQMILSYLSIGEIYKENKNYTLAIEYFEKVSKISKNENNKRTLNVALKNIAEVYFLQNKLDLSESFYNQSFKIQTEIKDFRNIASTFSGLGEISFYRKNYNKAIDFLNNSNLYAIKTSSSEIRKKNYLLLAQIYNIINIPQLAYNFQKKYSDLKDTLLNEKANKQLAETEAKYLNEKSEKEIAILNKDKAEKDKILAKSKYFRNFLIAGIIFIFILTVVLFRNNILKQRTNLLLKERNANNERQKEEITIFNELLQKENVLAQFETLKNQLNPHFLFNSLNILSSLVKIDTEKAVKFISEFSKVIRHTLEIKEFEVVPLSEESAITDSYIYLQKIRYNDKLKVKKHLEDTYLNVKIPPFALQILVENAIKHNIISEESPLEINIYIENDYLCVSNNLQIRNENVISTKVGHQNLFDRYRLISDLKPVFYIEKNLYIAKIPLIIN